MSTAPRPRISVFIAVGLDGYIARADGSLDWLSRVQLEGEDYGYQRFFDSVDALVIGRQTYDTALGFESWPYADKRCIVLTSRSATALHNEEFFDGPVPALAEKLGAEGVNHAYIDGGNVIQQFLAAKLVDEVTLSIIPVLLGAGIRLFAKDAPEQTLVLEESRSWPTGLTQVRYRLGKR